MPYIIKKSTLTGIADAIRGKTGGTDKMNPVEMASAIEGISAGGGDIDALIDGSITELTSNAESVVGYAFNSRKLLTKISLPLATTLGAYAFHECTDLTSVYLPKVTQMSSYTFYRCIELTHLVFPEITLLEKYNAFYDCSSLKVMDFHKLTQIKGSSAYFSGCKALVAFIVRSETVPTAQSKSTFNDTSFSNGTGYFYVPRALVDSYKSATNWSTYADQFRALEDYTVDGTITGELDESKI